MSVSTQDVDDRDSSITREHVTQVTGVSLSKITHLFYGEKTCDAYYANVPIKNKEH